MKIYFIPDYVRVLIFDIDSTLYTNEEYAHEQIDSQIRHFAALRGITAQQARAMIADFRKEWAANHSNQKISLGNLLTHFGISIEESIEWRKNLFNPFEYLKKDERLIETLKNLSNRFYLICVTNNPVLPAKKTLEALGVLEFFPNVIGLDSTKKSKPAKEIFDLAVNLAEKHTAQKIKYKNCISIGDRYDIDLALPLKLGMGAILVDGVKDVYELPNFL
ncbi:HAD family hydrolase [Treponema pectinovorum]|uniref:HAD family hydrolase n=1 Tax=Treponema pectinovorum TaxID=164 RepID=UPI0011F16B56|nr:HAD family hydrolase [Treponema pectinovorum]